MILSPVAMVKLGIFSSAKLTRGKVGVRIWTVAVPLHTIYHLQDGMYWQGFAVSA